MISAFFSTLHLFALVLGLPSIFFRARALSRLEGTAHDAHALEPVLRADTVWGLAALLWLATGLARAFGGLEKGTGYYLNNRVFLAKLGLFGLVFALELVPMVTLIRARLSLRTRPKATLPADRLARLSWAQVLVTTLIPFAASLMSRGIWA